MQGTCSRAVRLHHVAVNVQINVRKKFRGTSQGMVM